MVFSVTYYPELHIMFAFIVNVNLLPSKDANVM
jgi:hypothetical protein